MGGKDKSLTLDDSAQASNKGQLKVNLLRWFILKPTWPLIWAGAAVVFFLGVYLHWLFWVPTVLLVLANIFYWVRVREHFWHGDANPALVVSIDPLLISVATDLTKGIGSYPAVKIFRACLPVIDGEQPGIGFRLATVSLYVPSKEEIPHWDDFIPFPAQYATSNPKELAKIMLTFSEEDWTRLKQFLKQVPQPYQPGLYMIAQKNKKGAV